MDCERLFVENLGLIDQVVQFTARRHRLTRDEYEELAAVVKLKLLERDYDALRRFEGRSSLRTYLTVLVERVFLDRRIEIWGKWRPSASARRLGPVAVLFERLLTRDGATFDEALETLSMTHGLTVSRADLQAIYVQLPVRVGRRIVSIEDVTEIPDSSGREEAVVDGIDNAKEGNRVEAALAAALAELSAEDRLILRMRFQDGLQVSAISRLLQCDQKPLYRRLDHLLRALRRHLESRGVSVERIRALIDHQLAEIGPLIDRASPGPDEGARHV